MFNSGRGIQTAQIYFTDSFFLVFIWGYSVFLQEPTRTPNVPSQDLQKESFQTTVSKWILSLWCESTDCKAVSQIPSFWFLSEDILFFTIPLNELPNVSLQILHKEHFQPTDSTARFNYLRWKHTSQRSVTESFLLAFIWGYSVFHHVLQWALKCDFKYSTKEVFPTCWTKGKI